MHHHHNPTCLQLAFFFALWGNKVAVKMGLQTTLVVIMSNAKHKGCLVIAFRVECVYRKKRMRL